MPNRRTTTESLAKSLRETYPELESIAAAAAGDPVYLVGGAVRDLLLGRGRADIDLAVAGDPVDLADALGAATISEHERFATAKVELDGHRIDIAGTRTETYPRPGSLPVVSPADEIEADLARRDFSVNAMAVALAAPEILIDPHGGQADLEQSLLRVLHPDSFRDDPTRAIRAARYAARLDFKPEPETGALLRATDLGAVSEDRERAELLRLAAEASAPQGFRLLADWGLLDLREGGVELAATVIELLAGDPWCAEASRSEAVLAAALGPVGAEVELALARPARPSEAVELASPSSPVELALARGLGATWLDDYVNTWRAIKLEIDGSDLLAAGVPEGPAMGRALDATLRQKLDGQISGRDAELAAAVEAARSS
jgi:tRNA nucleotidyltransferase (CCA-adding enzyme)